MSNTVARDGDEELSLFLEMRRRENASSLLQHGGNSVEKSITESLVLTTTRSSAQLRKSAVEKFLDSEKNKSDYEWLLAVPEILSDKEGQENSMVKLKEPKARTALKPRVENIPQEPMTRRVKATSKQIPRLNSSTGFNKQANTVAEPPRPTTIKSSRQATPTTTSRTTSTKSNPRASPFTRSSSVGKSVKSTSQSTPETHVRPASTSRTRVNISSGERSTGRSKISNDGNPVLRGTQMVERVVNMRKLPPPKQDNNMSSSFGRSLSKSSLDMALRHMNIKRSKNLQVRKTINKIESSSSS